MYSDFIFGKFGYYYGNLRVVLIEVIDGIICDCGIEGFLLCEVVWCVGVLIGVFVYYFGFILGLLIEVVLLGYDSFGVLLNVVILIDDFIVDLW